MNNGQRMQKLIESGQTCISVVTMEENYSLGLVRDTAINLARPMPLWSVCAGSQDGLLSNSTPIPDTHQPDNVLAHFAEIPNKPICVTLDLCPHLKNDRTLRMLRNLLNQFRETGSQLVMIDCQAALPPVIRSYAAPFTISLPEEEEISKLVRETLRGVNRERQIEIDITRKGWHTVLRNLRGLSRRQIEAIVHGCVTDDRRFDDEDINHVLASKRQALAGEGLLEYIQTPVSTDEIGGLQHLKRWLNQRHGALSSEAKEYGIEAPRGVLMLGVQGAGKSLCAKAIATSWERPLLRMDVGALYDRYVGESERRLRDALKQAEMMAPIILWIDEIEKAFASAASQSTDGGLSKRMFGTLLTWMQEHRSAVFLVATANDIEALPPELLRKGRFDEIFFVDLPREGTRKQIFEIHLRKRNREPENFDIDALATAADGFSGAEIEQAVVSGLHDAFADKAELTTERLVKTIEASPPLSVTMAERVAKLREWAKGRCVPAD